MLNSNLRTQKTRKLKMKMIRTTCQSVWDCCAGNIILILDEFKSIVFNVVNVMVTKSYLKFQNKVDVIRAFLPNILRIYQEDKRHKTRTSKFSLFLSLVIDCHAYTYFFWKNTFLFNWFEMLLCVFMDKGSL